MKEIPISICMLTYNDMPYLEQNLQKLKVIGCELVIIDMDSTDGTGNLARQYADQFTTYEELRKQNEQGISLRGYDEGVARNMAASMASNPVILSVSSNESIAFLEINKLYHDIEGLEPMLGRVAVTEISGTISAKKVAIHKQDRIYHKEYHRYRGSIDPKLVRIRKDHDKAGKTKIVNLSMEVVRRSDLRSEEQVSIIANRAIENLEEKLKISSRDSERAVLLYLEGYTYDQMENWSEAILHFEKALCYEAVFPGSYLCKMIQLMGLSYCRLHRGKEGMELMERYESILEEHLSRQRLQQPYYLTQGNIYLENGNMKKAKEYFEKGIALGNYDKKGSMMMEVFQKLGAIYQSFSQEKEAEHCIWEQIRLMKKCEGIIRKYTN